MREGFWREDKRVNWAGEEADDDMQADHEIKIHINNKELPPERSSKPNRKIFKRSQEN